jgi:hypothetical protein
MIKFFPAEVGGQMGSTATATIRPSGPPDTPLSRCDWLRKLLQPALQQQSGDPAGLSGATGAVTLRIICRHVPVVNKMISSSIRTLSIVNK